jgi:hypothetical protein
MQYITWKELRFDYHYTREMGMCFFFDRGRKCFVLQRFLEDSLGVFFFDSGVLHAETIVCARFLKGFDKLCFVCHVAP